MLLTIGTSYILIILGNIETAFSQQCVQRDEVEAGRDCERACQPDGTCRKQNRECVCDGLCGLSCLKKKCPLLTAPLNGDMAINPNERTIGAEVSYSCNNGYVISGHANRVCQANKTWSGTQPICIDSTAEETCDENDLPANDWQIEFTYPDGASHAARLALLKPPGTIARFNCEHFGYGIVGSNAKICRGGEWHVPESSCEKIRCPLFELTGGTLEYRDENNRIVEQPRHGDIRTATCSDGYTLNGMSETLCSAGVWQDELPICEQTSETQCFRPWQIESGETVIFSTAVGGTVTFTCGPGFELVGDSVLICQGNGQWNGTIPFCYTDDPYGGAMPLTHEYGVDLYFLFDASDRIGFENFERSKRFARELIRKIGVTRSPNSLRMGAASFSDHAQISFHTADFQSTDEVNEGINRIQFTGGGTNINEALRVVSEVMILQSVQRNGSYKAVFITTDGNWREGGALVPEARNLKERGVKIFCLGFGPSASRDQFLEISSRPYREHVFLLRDFTSITQLVTKVVNQTEDFSECGVSENTVSRGRVIGGNDANPGAWPWQVFLDMRNGLQQFMCGGVLIDRYWVLTTATCLLTNQSVTIAAVLGMTDLSRPPHQQIEVEEAIPHPGYESRTLQNDIGLLKLRESARLNANVTPVCLPDKTRADRLIPPNPRYHTATLTGWGHNKTRQVVDDSPVQRVERLQQLALPLRSREECLQSLEGKPELDFFDESMFCAGYLGSLLGACKGDAGGPLVKKAIRLRQRRWVLIGLTSWGRGCAVQNELDFFTNVPYFMDWITETMNSTQEERGEGK